MTITADSKKATCTEPRVGQNFCVNQRISYMVTDEWGWTATKHYFLCVVGTPPHISSAHLVALLGKGHLTSWRRHRHRYWKPTFGKSLPRSVYLLPLFLARTLVPAACYRCHQNPRAHQLYVLQATMADESTLRIWSWVAYLNNILWEISQLRNMNTEALIGHAWRNIYIQHSYLSQIETPTRFYFVKKCYVSVLRDITSFGNVSHNVQIFNMRQLLI